MKEEEKSNSGTTIEKSKLQTIHHISEQHSTEISSFITDPTINPPWKNPWKIENKVIDFI